MGRKLRRVAFIAHALLEGQLSTALITERLKECGLSWPRSGETPGCIRWWSFPLAGPNGLVWVDFYIVPLLAPAFMGALKEGLAYQYVEEVALAAISEAQTDGVHLTLGWGAGTKNATTHGVSFLQKHPGLENISSTHGDAGTAQLVLEGLHQAGVNRGFRIAIIGANGVTGDAISRAVTRMTPQPESILLVGRNDDPGESRRLERLITLRNRVIETVGHHTEVVVHQDKSAACREHGSNFVVVATTADMMTLNPEDVAEGALVFDMTTPSACKPHPGWTGRKVLLSGCGEMPQSMLPQGFGQLAGRRHDDIGAGGVRVVWGCAIETFLRAAYGWEGHLSGLQIPLDALEWCHAHFKMAGIMPQPPRELVQHHVQPGQAQYEPLSWSRVREFVTNSNIARRRQLRRQA